MKIYTYGNLENPKLLFLHAALTNPEMYLPVLTLLSNAYYVIAPEADGHSLSEVSEFVSISNHVQKIEEYLLERKITSLDALYGVSMGGATALRFLADKKITVNKIIIDGGITPYRFVTNIMLNRLISKVVLLSDIAMVLAVRHATDRQVKANPMCAYYSIDTVEHLVQIMKHMSFRSAIRVFDSTNNYPMPDVMPMKSNQIQYWFGSLERKERRENIKFIQKLIPNITLRECHSMHHAELILEHPQEVAKEIMKFIDETK